MGNPQVVQVRAFVVDDGGDVPAHWVFDSKVASQMSRWPEYREQRRSWGITGPGLVIVEVETADGIVGVAESSGGEAGAFLVERHLARFVEGMELSRNSIADMWERMFYGTVHIGRRGLLLHAISAVDNALWDALGRCRDEPVWQLLGPRHHDILPCYATTHRPDIAKDIGFVGGKLPMPCGYAEGESGLAENLSLAAEMRERCGESSDFFLAVDCYMSLDVPTAIALANGLAELDYAWLEEALPPDDYWGYAELRREVAGRIAIATGEHEDTRWGFRLLTENGCADVLQPDVNWCGGLSELVKIAELADAHGVRLLQHAPGTVGVHFAVGRERPEPVEFLISDHNAPDQPRETIYLDDLWPEKGQIRPTDLPGFGRTFDPAVPLLRPYSH